MKRKIKWLNLFLIVILPLILSLLLFNPLERIPLKTVTKENITYIVLPEEYLNKQGLLKNVRENVRNIFSVPFDLKKYYLYLDSEGVWVDYPDGKVLEKAYFEISLNNRSINITEGKIPFGPLKIEKMYEYCMKIYSHLRVKEDYVIRSYKESELKKITMHPSFRVYARPLPSEIIVKIILFWLSWMSVCCLLRSICSLIIKNE